MSNEPPKREDLSSSNPVEAEIKRNVSKEHSVKRGIVADQAAIDAAWTATKVEEGINAEYQSTLREKGQNLERERDR